MWGFWSTNYWKKSTIKYRDDISLTRRQTFNDLLLVNWRPNDKCSRDPKSAFVTQGFNGQ